MNAKNKINDKLIYIKLRQKDREAFAKAYDQYIDDIYRFIFFKVGSKEEAEDLTSQVFLKSWNHIQNNRLTDFKSLKALFYKVARNIVIDHYRKGGNAASVSLDDPGSPIDIPDMKSDLAKNFDTAVDFAALLKTMDNLKGEYREALVMRFVNELSVSEIATILEKSNGNVRVLLYRAVSAVKKLLEDGS